MSDNKYKLFRNYMVNELGIGKDDIQEWTKQAVTETVEKVLHRIDIKDFALEQTNRILNSDYKYASERKQIIKDAISEILSKQLDISIALKGKEQSSPTGSRHKLFQGA